jgi:hypothetical protein
MAEKDTRHKENIKYYSNNQNQPVEYFLNDYILLSIK